MLKSFKKLQSINDSTNTNFDNNKFTTNTKIIGVIAIANAPALTLISCTDTASFIATLSSESVNGSLAAIAFLALYINHAHPPTPMIREATIPNIGAAQTSVPKKGIGIAF